MTVHFFEKISHQICIDVSDVDIREALMTDSIKKKIKPSSSSRLEKKHVDVLPS
jgi:hypothetical protein